MNNLDIPDYTIDQVNRNWHVDKRNIVLDNEGHIVHEPCNPAWAGAPVVSKLIASAPKLLRLLMEYVITDELNTGWQEGNEPYDILCYDAESLIKQFYPDFNRLKEESVYIKKYLGVPREELVALGLIKDDEQDKEIVRWQV